MKDKRDPNNPENCEDEIYNSTDDLDDMVIDMDENECSPEEYVELHREEVHQFMMSLGKDKKKSTIEPNDLRVTAGVIIAVVLFCTLVLWLCI